MTGATAPRATGVRALWPRAPGISQPRAPVVGAPRAGGAGRAPVCRTRAAARLAYLAAQVGLHLQTAGIGDNACVFGLTSAGRVSPSLPFGAAEQWIKEGKQAVKMTRLSCHRFRSNEVRLWLSVIAYNLGNLWRRLALPNRIGNWSLTSLQQRLVKTGGRLVKHARYYWLLLAASHLTRRLFGSMVRRIGRLTVASG